MNLRNKYVPYFFLAIAVLVVYSSTLLFNYTYLDDNVLILDQQKFLSDFSNVWQAFHHDVFFSAQNQAYYRPLLTVSLMIDTLWGGGKVWTYHLGNILIHLASVWLIYATIIKMKYRHQAALIITLIFAVHPILSQAVAWIPGRNDSLLAVFALASFYLLIDARQWSKILSIIFFTLALFTKETTLVLPLIFLMYKCLIQKKILFSVDNFYLIAGCLGVIILWLPLRAVAFSHPLETNLVNLIRSALANLPAIFIYLGKIIFPFNLTVLPNLVDSNYLWGFVTLSIIIIGLWLSRQMLHLRGVTFGLIWFVVLLIPSFVRPNSEIMPDFLEHRVYLPMFGLLIVVLEIGLKNINLKKLTHLYLASSIIIGLSLMSFFHSQKFVSRIVFWEDATAGSPSSPLAHRNLGAMYYLNGELKKSKPHFEKALELNKNEPMAHNNLGLIYLNQERFNEAQQQFEAEIAINPSWETAYFNLGLVFSRQNKNEEAKAMWQKTLEINPNYTDAKEAIRALAK